MDHAHQTWGVLVTCESSTGEGFQAKNSDICVVMVLFLKDKLSKS
jgi:hypothetical protein